MTEADATIISKTTAEPWRAGVAWCLLDGAARADLDILFRFVAAARAVADHPALAPERKEAALAALAAPFGGPATSLDNSAADNLAAETSWAEPARALAGLIAARGLDGRGAWRILQAAGQDLRKSRYRDWSDLLTWCHFSAAPVGTLVTAILQIAPEQAKKAEALAVARQMVDIVVHAPSHYRWLGRVYLPERWFAEAQGEIADIGFQRRTPALGNVMQRALDQATALAGEAEGLARGIKGWRRRAALHAFCIELAQQVHALAQRDDFAQTRVPGKWARRIIWLRAAVRGLRSGA